MHKLNIVLETVTPLFLGGANPRGTPELRPAPFRGALRFWLRALLGAHNPNRKWVRKEEEKVFGSTDRASSIVVRCGDLLSSQIERIDEPAPRRNQINRSYLFYGLEKRYKNHRNQWRLKYRPSVKVGESLGLTLSCRAGVTSEHAWQCACAALWLLTHLGALGARARRGAGSIQATSSPDGWPEAPFPPLAITAENPDSLRIELTIGIAALRQSLGLSKSSGLPALVEFDILHPSSAQVYVVNRIWSRQEGWKRVLDDFAKIMGGFRYRYGKDYLTVKAVAGGRASSFQAERAAFGLPLPFYFSSTGDKAIVEGEKHDRRASPLLVRVVRYANEQGYGLVLTYFKAQLIPDSQLVATQPQPRGGKKVIGRGPVPGLGLVETFLQEISSSTSRYYLAPLLRVKL